MFGEKVIKRGGNTIYDGQQVVVNGKTKICYRSTFYIEAGGYNNENFMDDDDDGEREKDNEDNVDYNVRDFFIYVML